MSRLLVWCRSEMDPDRPLTPAGAVLWGLVGAAGAVFIAATYVAAVLMLSAL